MTKIDAFEDLTRVLREHWGGHFIFRGEPSCEYELRSKWGRYQSASELNTPEVEAALLSEFRRLSAPLVDEAPQDEWEWLALAQHFGLATRMLDWTENPLVALYFAVKPSRKEDRVLYLLDHSSLEEPDQSISPFDCADATLYLPRHIAPRIASQSGVFTVHPNPSEVFEHPGLERFEIGAECTAELLVTLASYGIHEASVFRDVGGMARHLNSVFVRGISIQM